MALCSGWKDIRKLSGRFDDLHFNSLRHRQVGARSFGKRSWHRFYLYSVPWSVVKFCMWICRQKRVNYEAPLCKGADRFFKAAGFQRVAAENNPVPKNSP